MKYRIEYLPIADRDVLAMSDALADYPYKAKRIFQEMEEKLILLEDLPYMWPAYPQKPEYRRMILEDYLLFYMVDDVEHIVKVYRILYGKMDIPRHMRGFKE